MRTALLGIAAAVLTTLPVFAADLQVPPYSEGAYTYEREYWEPPPRVVVVPPPSFVTEFVPAPIIVRRPVVVVRPPIVIYQPVYASPETYAYSYPVRRFGPW